jgi:hypothetical protein
MAKSERQLRLSPFAPFVESVGRNQAATLGESLPERGRSIDGLSSGVDGPVSDLWVLRSIRDIPNARRRAIVPEFPD